MAQNGGRRNKRFKDPESRNVRAEITHQMPRLEHQTDNFPFSKMILCCTTGINLG